MKTTRMSQATIFPARLTDEQWAILQPLVPAGKPGGRPLKKLSQNHSGSL